MRHFEGGNGDKQQQYKQQKQQQQQSKTKQRNAKEIGKIFLALINLKLVPVALAESQTFADIKLLMEKLDEGETRNLDYNLILPINAINTHQQTFSC